MPSPLSFVTLCDGLAGRRLLVPEVLMMGGSRHLLLQELP